jgi:magnesium transporter
MPVVAACLYRNGERLRGVTIEERIHCPDDRSQFVWIGMRDPTAQEMEQLHLHYDLHPLAVEDALKANQLPKVDVYCDQLFVMARTAHYAGSVLHYGETPIFVGHSHIISVRYGSTRSHTRCAISLKLPLLLGQGVD